MLWLLGIFKIPMVGYVRPRLIAADSEQISVKMRLRRRTRNHLKSMYFGSMSVGADLAAGLYTYYVAGENYKRMSFVFKSMSAEFHRRAETDVLFICREGKKLEQAVTQALESGERVHETVEVLVQDQEGEIAATFQMTVSVKFKG